MTKNRFESNTVGHHVTAHACPGRLVIVTRLCAQAYLDLLGTVALRRGWIVITYIVMGNHVHFVVWTPEADLGAGMKEIQEAFAHIANDRDGKRNKGHFWCRRFDNKPVFDENHATAALRYVARNPVKHEMGTVEGWEPSAHHPLLGTQPCPAWLARDAALDFVGGVDAYAALVAKDDETLAGELLRAFGEAEGVRRAIDVHGMQKALVLRVFGLAERTFYRRLNDGRAAHKLATQSGVPLIAA